MCDQKIEAFLEKERAFFYKMDNGGVTVEDVIEVYELEIKIDKLYMNPERSGGYVQTGKEWIESYIDDDNFYYHNDDCSWESWGGDNLIEVEQNKNREWLSSETKELIEIEDD